MLGKLTSLLALNYSSINKASYDISVNLNAPYDVQLFDDKQVFDEYLSANCQMSLLIKWLFGTTTKQIIQSFQYVALIFVSLMMNWQKP